MTRIRFDQLAKQYLEAFLEPLGTVQRNLEVPGESKFVDVWFTPNGFPPASTADLGLLSRIATTRCLLEPFRNAPTRQEVRSCLSKLLWILDDQRRQIAASGQPQQASELPRLWILTATTTKPVVAAFGGQVRTDWLPGVYFAPEGFKLVIVAIDELPILSETLWLRILGRDATQQQAIAELVALSRDDPRRSKVLELLVNWRITLEVGELVVEDRSEGELMATLSQAYLEWEQQTRAQGIEQGLQSGQATLVIRQLKRRLRLEALPHQLEAQIRGASVAQLEELGEVLLDFTSVQELNEWLQTHPLNDRV